MMQTKIYFVFILLLLSCVKPPDERPGYEYQLVYSRVLTGDSYETIVPESWEETYRITFERHGNGNQRSVLSIFKGNEMILSCKSESRTMDWPTGMLCDLDEQPTGFVTECDYTLYYTLEPADTVHFYNLPLAIEPNNGCRSYSAFITTEKPEGPF